jgi:hypothetical protein
MNKYRPHVHVLPEDGANRKLANGFLQDVALDVTRIQVLPEAGGWVKVIETFLDQVPFLEKTPDRHMILLVDFDGNEGRPDSIRDRIPKHLSGRVFVLGARSKPEDLKRELGGSYEEIGRKLAKECREGADYTWGHRLLDCNRDEIARLRERVRPILFPTAE